MRVLAILTKISVQSVDTCASLKKAVSENGRRVAPGLTKFVAHGKLEEREDQAKTGANGKMKLLRKLPSPRMLLRPQDHLLGWMLGIRYNHNLDDAKKDICKLLDGAQFEVLIVAGKLEQGVFASEEVLPKFKAALERNVIVRLLCSSDLPETAKPVLDLADKYDKFKIRKAPTYPAPHYIVVDRKKVRLEEYHPPGSSERHAKTVTRTWLLGNQLVRDFQKQWSGGRSANNSNHTRL